MRVTVHNRGPEAADSASAAAALVSQHLVLETGRGPSTPSRLSMRTPPPHRSPRPGRLPISLRRQPATAFHRKRNQFSTLWTARKCRRLLQRRLPPIPRSRQSCRRQSSRSRHQSAARITNWIVPAGGAAVVRLRLTRSDAPSSPSTILIRFFDQRRQEADEFYAALQRDISRPRRPPGAAAGLGRHALDQTILPLRHCRSGCAATRPSRRRPRNASRAATRLDAPQQRRHSLHARQVGISLVRGLGPGLPHACRWR